MLDAIKKQLSEYEIAVITRENFKQVFEVYDTNQDFFLLTQGREATIDTCVDDIDALPPTCGAHQKIYVSICEQDNIIAVMDLITGYPDETTVWIGLLLVHGDMQCKKIGSRIAEAVIAAAYATGYKLAQLGVIESNTKAITFWQRHGFDAFRQSDNIVVMARRVV